VVPALTAAGLAPPALAGSDLRRDQHSPHLAELLAELQCVARADPEAEW
jgi:1,2-phenylacetyl-CoA epoxidase catalytic subunit